MSTTFCVVCACAGTADDAIRKRRKRKPAIQYLAMLRIDDLLEERKTSSGAACRKPA
jgi:hypothetical protein